jgi:hypothetical protein
MKKPKFQPRAFDKPYDTLKTLVCSLFSRPYPGLPIGKQQLLEPYRASQSLSLINCILSCQERIRIAKEVLSPSALEAILPWLEADLADLKERHKRLLNERQP